MCELEHQESVDGDCVEPARCELEHSGVEHTTCELEHRSPSMTSLPVNSPGSSTLIFLSDVDDLACRSDVGFSFDVGNGKSADFEGRGEDSASSASIEQPTATVPRSGRSRRSAKYRFAAPNSCCKDASCNSLNTITVVPQAGSVCSIGDEEFVQVDMMVDSGATETVMAEWCLDGVIDISEGAALKRGIHYECANGTQIPNLGGRRFLGTIEEQGRRAVTAQVCAVTKNLLSVNGMTRNGHRVVFDEDGSYIEDKTSGERSWLHEVNGMYMLKLWVSKKTSKEAGF